MIGLARLDRTFAGQLFVMLVIDRGDLVDGGQLCIMPGGGMGVERPELCGKGGLRFGVQRLVAEEDDLVPDDGGANGIALLGCQRLADVQTVNFRADGGLQRSNIERYVSIGCGSGGMFRQGVGGHEIPFPVDHGLNWPDSNNGEVLAGVILIRLSRC
jgi:hypothetical protein